MSRPYLELRELEAGTRFLFYADDLEQRGPCTLVSKGVGSATIDYEPRTVTRTFKARDKDGQIVERTITQRLSGRTSCALGAQVVALEGAPPANYLSSRVIEVAP
jgi:hypothetical protein